MRAVAMFNACFPNGTALTSGRGGVLRGAARPAISGAHGYGTPRCAETLAATRSGRAGVSAQQFPVQTAGYPSAVSSPTGRLAHRRPHLSAAGGLQATRRHFSRPCQQVSPPFANNMEGKPA